MQITGGALKGRKLVSWKSAPGLRPMTAQTRQSLFNAIAPRFFEGCLVLDLFSGTGSLAIEALSRGAGLAYAVESGAKAFNLIKKNKKLLPDPKKLVLRKKNVFSFLKGPESDIFKKTRAKKLSDSSGFPQKFNIITADPPFALQFGEKIISALRAKPFIARRAVLILETGPKENLKTHYPHCYLFKQKSFNDKILRFYEFE